MKKTTHQVAEEERDDFCREVVNMASASEEEINAAINAPFLYARLRTRIAEAEARTAVVGTTRAKHGWWQWRWALAVVAIALLAGMSWRWMQVRPMVVQQGGGVVPVVPVLNDGTNARKGTAGTPLHVATTKTVRKPVKTRRVTPVPVREDLEIATDYLPLTYIAKSDERSGQVVRVELPRSAMLALGLPVNQEAKSDLVKADVIVGDDGLALAIRFVR